MLHISRTTISLVPMDATLHVSPHHHTNSTQYSQDAEGGEAAEGSRVDPPEGVVVEGEAT